MHMRLSWTPSQLPPVLRVHPELAGMFADEMDILSLSRWRCACRTNYQHASASLRRTLTNRLQAFIPYPHDLLDIVTKYGAIFGGEVALSFILRHDRFRPSNLEIYTSQYHFNELCKAILDNARIRTRIKNYGFLTMHFLHTMRRLVSGSLVIHMKNGSTIYVHQSRTCSPSAPITRSTCTALSNFVTSYGFGCSPELTLARRALLSDREMLHISPHDAQSLDHLLAHGFSLAVAPTAWPEYRMDMDGRFFGDRGSFVGYFDPLDRDKDRCMDGNIAPFGSNAIWRVWSSFECDDGCEDVDEVLERGVASVPVLFKKDPFRKLEECLSSIHASVFEPRCVPSFYYLHVPTHVAGDADGRKPV
ncbi:hypothetical protein V8D89_008241 [Ganoderma adspersum]